MILYLDTSALVKLYVREPNSREVRKALAAAREVATHAIAYVEARAAFARKARESGHAHHLDRWRQAFDRDWSKMSVLGVDETLVRQAADLSEQHALRGFDAVHLAAARRVFHALGPAASQFRFIAYDRRLQLAAGACGLPA